MVWRSIHLSISLIAVLLTTAVNAAGPFTVTNLRVRDTATFDSSVYLTSTTSSKLGVIYKSGSRFLHDFHHPTGGGAVPTGINLFIGEGSGNFTAGSTASAVNQASLNLGIGAFTLPALTIGDFNTNIGPYSGNKITEARYSVGIGPYTLYSLTTGNYNFAAAYRALYLATTAQFDNATGASTLYNCLDCSYCNGYGTNALNALVHGSFHDAFGYRASFYLIDSSYVGSFGYYAGAYYGAGTNHLTLADRSLFIGPLTRAGGNSQTNQVVIGYNVVGQGSNTTTIGNTDVVSSYIRGDVILDSDDKYIKFGDSQDATIGYESDGNMHFNSRAVGSGSFNFDSGYVNISKGIKASGLATDSTTDSIMGKNAGDDTLRLIPNIKKAIHACIHNHDDTITIAVPTGVNYEKISTFPLYYSSVYLVADTANDQIIVPEGYNGYYNVEAHLSTYVGTANVVIRTVVFLNEDEQDQTHDEDKFLTSGDKRALIVSGVIKVEDAPDTITIRARHDSGGSVNINITYCSLRAIYMGVD